MRSPPQTQRPRGPPCASISTDRNFACRKVSVRSRPTASYPPRGGAPAVTSVFDFKPGRNEMKLKLTTILGATVAVVASAFAAQAQTVLKWAHVYETSEPFHTESVWAAEELAKRTDGRYKHDVFPASQLGTEAYINHNLRPGTVDILIPGPTLHATH